MDHIPTPRTRSVQFWQPIELRGVARIRHAKIIFRQTCFKKLFVMRKQKEEVERKKYMINEMHEHGNDVLRRRRFLTEITALDRERRWRLRRSWEWKSWGLGDSKVSEKLKILKVQRIWKRKGFNEGEGSLFIVLSQSRIQRLRLKGKYQSHGWGLFSVLGDKS